MSQSTGTVQITVFYNFFPSLYKGSPCCYGSTVALFSISSFAVISPQQYFTLECRQLGLLHLLSNHSIDARCLNTAVWLGPVQWKVAKNFDVVEWQYQNAERTILKHVSF